MPLVGVERTVIHEGKDFRRTRHLELPRFLVSRIELARKMLGLDLEILVVPRNANRRAVRVSMGSVFLVPWTWLDGPITSLHEYGFHTAAMALSDNSISLDDTRLKEEPRLAVIMGTEGDGLPQQTISEADYTVKIPMAHHVDSLNVAAAAAVAFWELRK